MARQTLTLTLRIEGIHETLRAFRRLPKDASNQLRQENLKLSQGLADDAATAARSEGHQAALMAPTVKANRDRVPSVSAGGSKRVGRYRTPAWRLLFASEFGMNRRSGWYGAVKYAESPGRQYKPSLSKVKGSYWFFKTVEAQQDDIARAWNRVADDILRAFSRGGA